MPNIPFYAHRIFLIIFVIGNGFSASILKAQVPCKDNVLDVTYVVNAQCGQNSGTVFMSLHYPANQFTFEWTPNVSNTNEANGLLAYAYHVRVIQNSNPTCIIDTLVLVHNSDGPEIDTAHALVDPASCYGANGRIEFPNHDPVYTWSNGETTNYINEGLASGCYIVTATNPSDGCYDVAWLCIPNNNPLTATYEVLTVPKCGMPTGVVKINMAGGSGQYTFNGNSSATIGNLVAGNYNITVVDQQYQCSMVVAVTVPEITVEGSVDATAHSPTCPDAGNGFVEFQVTPGMNFKMPFTYQISNGSGNIFTPNNLPAGQYELKVSDADGCTLPLKSVLIIAPPAFQANATVLPETNAGGGSIALNLSGGNGNYTIDWEDLPGKNNPEDRINLSAGLYQGVVYDGLACAYPIGPYLVPDQALKPDTLYLFVAQNSSQTYCAQLPPGVAANGAVFSLSTGGLAGNSAHGNWTLQSNGCLNYAAGSITGFAVDTICIRRIVPGQMSLNGSVCLIITIVTTPPVTENVYFEVQANSSANACGTIPVNYPDPVILPFGQPDLSGMSGQYGNFQINPNSACISFQAAGLTGYNVDNICLSVYSASLQQCHIICYVPSILPQNGCSGNLINVSQAELSTNTCTVPSSYCIDIPFDQIANFAIQDNLVPYTGGSVACDFDTILIYKTTNLPLVGPYQLTGWQIGSQNYTGSFKNMTELVVLMNQFDPAPGWTLKSDLTIVGGNPSKSYGAIQVSNTLGAHGSLALEKHYFANKTELHFLPGNHTVVFKDILNGCADTLQLNVLCIDCPPIHHYALDINGRVVGNAGNCNAKYLFCTTIPLNQISQYTFADNQAPFNSLSACGSQVALQLDTGLHHLVIKQLSTNCKYEIPVFIDCDHPVIGDLKAFPDKYTTPLTGEIDLKILENDLVFGTLANANGLTNVILSTTPQLGGATYIADEGLLRYYPENGQCGLDTFQYTLIDTLGRMSSALVSVEIVCKKLLIFNGISPNGDGKNDDWRIIGIENYPNNEVSVFNRWGNLVFRKKPYDNDHAWDAASGGQYLPDGTYFYVIDLGNGEKALSGYLQILR
ncbi:MAG: gliding motility-associated C-terminal domain-containing protein [Bacteroidota bacterium]